MSRGRFTLETAGESHGACVAAILSGVPAGLRLDLDEVNAMLARRQGGYGRGGRMKIERDRVVVNAGLRRGVTLGSPILLEVANRDHRIDEAPEVTRPRPGHVDLAGMMKYATADARDVLERSSARETAARVAAGAVAAQLLARIGVSVVGFTRSLGGVSAEDLPGDAKELGRARDASPFFCPSAAVTEEMKALVDRASREGDTLGGWVEVQAFDVPPGLGTNACWDARLDARLAAALMSIPAMKAVEIGLGGRAADLFGSEVHDPILPGDPRPRREGNHAGGIEGGITNGEVVVARAAMKPLSSLKRGMPSVDLRTGETALGARERSDVTAVPAASVVAEAMVATILAQALLEKTGGDTMEEVERNLHAYLDRVDQLF